MGELDRTEMATPDDALVGEAEGLGPKRPPEAKDVRTAGLWLGNRQGLLYVGKGIPTRNLWALGDCRFAQSQQQSADKESTHITPLEPHFRFEDT